MTIDVNDPNAMMDSKDIGIYNKKVRKQRLFQPLTEIDDKFEAIKREILKRNLCLR